MKRFTSILLLLAILAGTLSLTSCGMEVSLNPERPSDIPEADTSEYDLSSDVYRTIAENDNLRLDYNDLTTDIKVTVKKNGYEWSTEYDDGMGEIIRGSIFSMNYYTSTGAIKTVDSGIDSVEKGQFLATEIENGIKIQYGLGDINFKIAFPLAISVERKDAFYANMTFEQQIEFDDNYTLIDFDDPRYDEYEQEDIDSSKRIYSLAANGSPWYYWTARNTDKNINNMNHFWSDLGYTTDDFNIDSQGVTVPTTERPEFCVSIYYTLEADGLKVNIPEKEIYYTENYTVENLLLHPGLAAFTNEYDGYFLLPDGSGSIMNFNNEKDDIRNDPVYIQMYGVDDSRSIDEKSAYYNDAILPVFGACVKGPVSGASNEANFNGMLAVIESGDTFSGVEAHSSTDGTLNTVWNEFRINESVKIASFSSSASSSSDKYSKYQFQRYLGDLTMTYHFLTGEDATYSGMAKFYSNKLFGNEQSELRDYYSTVETVGLINGNGVFMGISYNEKVSLTTFDQVAEIAKDLKDSGFDNLNIKMTGWCNGGYEHGYLKTIKPSSQLGGKDKLTELIATMKEMGVGLYPDIDFQYVYAREKVISKNDNASTLNGSRSWICNWYDPVNFAKTSMLSKYVLTMPAVSTNLNNFMNGYSEYDTKNVSFRSLGQKISANYREKDIMERQETLENLIKLTQGVKDSGYSIMGTSGDAPFATYLDVINEMPVESAGFDKCDYSVPFTAMVYSGHLDYTYRPINLSNGERDDLLKLIESNAGASFTFTANSYDDIAYTSYDYLYSSVYSELKDNALEKYNYLKEALSDVYGLEIIKHEALASGVNRVTYGNGISIVVNYNDTDYNANGVSVKANDYIKIKEAA